MPFDSQTSRASKKALLGLATLALLGLASPQAAAQSLAEASKLYEKEIFKPALAMLQALEKARGIDSGKALPKATAKEDPEKALDARLKALKEKEREDFADTAGLLARIRMRLGQFDQALLHAAFAKRCDPEAWGMYYDSISAQISFINNDDKACQQFVDKLPKDAGWIKDELPFLIKGEGLTSALSKKKRYKIYVDSGLAAKKSEEFIGRVMDTIFEAYSKVFPFKTDKRIVYRVYVFSTTAGYLDFNAKMGKDKRGSAGYFAPSTRILCIDAAPRGEKTNEYGIAPDAINTMFHEGFHQFINNFAPGVPLWFNEGIAEYFGPSVLVSKGTLNVGVIPKTHPTLMTRYETIRGSLSRTVSPGPLNLKVLITNEEAFSHGDGRTNMSYAQSWSFIHFLLHSKAMAKQGKKLIKQYFDIIADGEGIEKAFAETFGKLNLEELYWVWAKYVLEEM